MKRRWTLWMLVAMALAVVAGCSGQEEAKQTPSGKAGGIHPPVSAPEAPNASYRAMFSNSLFLGDSIIGGLTNDDLLDTANVMGGLGATVAFTLEHVDEVVRRKPEYVFLSMGQNDIDEPLAEAEDRFKDQYSELVRQLKAKLPGSKINILSITPLSSDAAEGVLSNANIDRFNRVLKDVAETEQVKYLDLSPIFENHDVAYDGDGSHFTNGFYPLLLDDLIERTDIATQPKTSVVIDANEAYKETFQNSVFMGDSIIGELSYLDKLDKAHVIAPSGATLDLLQLNVFRLSGQQPEHLFILIGSNDIKLVDRQKFIEKYATLIRNLKKELPDAEIRLLSITPVSDEALRQEPRYQNIEAFNESIEALAAAEKVRYVDLAPLFERHAIEYAQDGIRFKPEFYSLFLDDVAKELEGEKE